MSEFECPPVLIVGFKRPDFLKQVLDAVRKARPKHLFLALDYPRPSHPDDALGYEECRKVFEQIDWDCDVKRNYASENMGCGRRMTSGISWVFEHEDRAIVLEDDCVPHPSFFRFCAELLERYKDDSRVGMIAAECEHFRKAEMDFRDQSYYFDRMCLVWGWATWRRAWRLHDPSLAFIDDMIASDAVMNIFARRRYVRKWERNIVRIRDGGLKTWAAGWAATIYRENMLVAHAVANPVVNIGQSSSSREGAVEESFLNPGLSNKVAEEIAFPLRHPKTMIPDVRCERYCLEDLLYRPAWKKALENPRLAFKRLWRTICR